jgi:hypothetical protein
MSPDFFDMRSPSFRRSEAGQRSNSPGAGEQHSSIGG